MAGTISLSFSQRVDNATGEPLSEGRLYFFQAGTTTPQNAYQDYGLTIPHPNPIILDAGGNIPQFFLADGFIKIRLENSAGSTQLAADQVLVVGPSSGGGGGGSVDPTTVLATGDMKVRYGIGALSGFIRANGRTIGSATSGATERANADCEALFKYLWDVDGNLAVSGGRGGTAAADWAANKTIASPDWRGRLIAGLDDMGNSAASRLTSSFFGLQLGQSSTVLGGAGGKESHTQTVAQMPGHVHPNVLTDPGHRHGYSAFLGIFQGATGSSANIGSLIAADTAYAATGVSITNAPQGGGEAFPIVPPMMVTTIYLKL